MKHLKEKLFATIAMLLVATVMLTSASFAWFSISTAPEVTNIKASVTSNGNLEIALDSGADTPAEPAESLVGDSGKNETWGNLVDLTKYFDSANITLKPVKAIRFTGAKGDFQKPNYGLDGRIKSLTDLERVQAPDNGTVGTDKFSDLGGVHAFSETTDGSKGDVVYAFEVDYWLRTNVDGNQISLSTSVPRDTTTNVPGGDFGSEQGLGSWITDNTTTVVIADGAQLYVAVPGTIASGRYPLTLHKATLSAGKLTVETGTSTIPLTKNTAKELKMFVYLSGAEINNQNVNTVNPDAPFGLNIQFVGSATLNDMNVLEKDNGAFDGTEPIGGTHTDNQA